MLAVALGAAPFAAGCRKDRAGVTTKGAAIPTPPARGLYVTNNGSDSLSVIDRDGVAVTTVSVDIDPDEREAPHHLAVDGTAGAAFVALSFPAPPSRKKKDPHGSHGSGASHGTLARLNLSTLAVTDTRDLDHNPGDIVFTHDRARLLVTHFDLRLAMTVASQGGTAGSMFASLQVWDAKALTLFASRPLCVAPHGVTTTADDRRAIVACYGSDELALVDLTTPELQTARFPLGSATGVPGAPRYGPYSVALSPDGRRVVVATLEASDLRVFDLEERRFLSDHAVFLRARAFFPAFVDASRVLVPTQGPDGLVRVDLDRAVIEARAPWPEGACRAPHAVRRAKDGRWYVVCEGDHASPGAVVEVDPQSLAVRRTWTVGVYPDGMAFGDE